MGKLGQWRAWAVALAVANTGYAAFRAQVLKADDLFHGYVDPARAVVFGHANPAHDYPFNSFAPLFYVLMAPLSLLPVWLASVLWSLVSFGFLVGALQLVAKMGERPTPGVQNAWLPLVAGAPLVCDNINLGQSNLLPLFFVCAALFALERDRPAVAGFALSFAIAWKLTPALFVVWLVVQRRWRALAATAAGLIWWWGLVPCLVYGPDRALVLTVDWVRLVVSPFVSGHQGLTTNISWYHTNQSLEAALQRALTPYGQAHYRGLHPFTDPALLDERHTHLLATGFRVAIVGLLALLALTNRHSLRLLGALYLLGALFISPASWFSHYVAALVAYVACWAERDGPGKRWLTWALAVTAALTWVSLGSYMRSHSLVFAGHFALFGVLAWHTATSPAAKRTTAPSPARFAFGPPVLSAPEKRSSEAHASQRASSC